MEMVYVDNSNENPECICPRLYEKVNCEVGYKGYFKVKEYPIAKDGCDQYHRSDRFRPLSDVLAEISLTELMEEAVEC